MSKRLQEDWARAAEEGPRVLMKVKHLIFPVDIPLILGYPFMSTASCMVDTGKKILQMGIEDQKISFELFHEDKDPPSQNVCLKLHVMEEKRPKKKVLEVGTLLDPGLQDDVSS